MTLIAGAAYSLLDPEAARIALRLVSFGLGSTLAALVYSLARRFGPVHVAILAAGASILLPVVLQQISDIYLELPLAVLTLLSVTLFLNARPMAAMTCVAVAILVKPTGIALVPMAWVGLNLHPGRPRFSTKALSTVLVAMAGLIAVGLRPTGQPREPWLLDHAIYLLRDAARNLVLMPDVFVLIFAATFLIRMEPAKRRTDSLNMLVRMSLATILGFAAIVGAGVVGTRLFTVLPRYYVMILPLCIALIAILLHRRFGATVASAVLIGLLVWSVVNQRGDLYPEPNHPHPTLAERSLRALDYTALMADGARSVAGADSAAYAYVSRHLYFRLAYPELGYVDTSDELPDISVEPPGCSERMFVAVLEPHWEDDHIEEYVAAAASESGEATVHHLQRGPFTSTVVAGPVGRNCR